MPDQQAISSENKGTVPQWVRLCRWLWKRPLPFFFWTLLINVAINIGSTWFITGADTKTIADTSPVGRVTGWMAVHWPVSLVIGTLSAAVLLVTWIGNRWPDVALSAQQRVPISPQDRQRMLRRLRLRYEQMLAQSLQGVVQMELGLVSRPAAIHNAASLFLRLPDQTDQPLPLQTSIENAYEQAQQELLILGEPGAGKSTLLLELAHSLSQKAENHATQPLPFVLPLSTWANYRPALQDWLAEQVALLYAVPRALGRQWVQADLILPLLDGLDEMEESARPACIAAINAYHREHLSPLVVCSRTYQHEQAAAHERLALHTAVVVQPLSHEQIQAYLAQLGKPLAGLRRALKQNTVLAELSTTPLMLHILILTYQGTTVQKLSEQEAVLQQQIWTMYVKRMVARKGDSKHYPLDRTCSWLGWLASLMRQHSQTIFVLEGLQPDALPQFYTLLYRCSVGLFVGLVFGLLLGLGKEPFAGLFFGLPLGLVFGLSKRLVMKIEPVERVAFSWQGLRRGLISGLGTGLLFGLVAGLVIESLNGLVVKLFAGLIFGLIGGLVCGLAFGLIGGLERRQLTNRDFLSPNEGMRRSLTHGVSLLLFVGLIGGLIGGLVLGPGNGLVLGLFVGLLLGLLFGLGAVAQHYMLRFWLARSGLFPWKVVSFLEDATARAFLRRVGGGYQFTHQLLMDYFADLNTTKPATPPPSP